MIRVLRSRDAMYTVSPRSPEEQVGLRGISLEVRSTHGPPSDGIMADRIRFPAKGAPSRGIEENQYGALAQLVARYIRIVEVRSSNLLCSTSRRGLHIVRGVFVAQKHLSFIPSLLLFELKQASIRLNEAGRKYGDTETGLAPDARFVMRFHFRRFELARARSVKKTPLCWRF